MGDPRSTIENEIWRRVESQLPKFDAALEGLAEAELMKLAHSAATQIVGPLVLRDLLGEDRLDTTKTALLLGVTRQAINKRVHAHTLLGVPGRGTTWFPLWQFDAAHNEVRHVAELVLQVWASFDDAGRLPWNAVRVLSWASATQEELDGSTPGEWISSNGEPEPVLAAARRAGRALAQ
jgi:hypothetical protein